MFRTPTLLRALPRRATAYRPLAVHSIRTFADSGSVGLVSEAIKRDHRELEEYYNNIMCATDADTATRWQNQFVWELARHSIAEEIVVYPAFEKHIPDGVGKRMADKDRKEHQEVKNLLYKFQQLKSSDPKFKQTLSSIWRLLSEHIKEEEREDLPALERHLAQDASQSMAASFGRTKHFVPTHSHPSAPDVPPYETAVGMLATPVDKLMDMFKKFPNEDTPAPGRDKMRRGGASEVVG